ncbi:MAG: D-alanine--D-alanine ligase [Candidatus Liptonbacteria bacterium]|nr:D-alanine--D-alanine ligase [Candidatus Liptonbacteria bacterium]
MKKVAILGGGPSSEHVVSLATAKNVFLLIDRKKYKPELLFLTKKKELFLGKKRLSFPKDLKKYDIIFNALHGAFGEDGELQTILDKLVMKYTGSGAKASRIGMDKWESKRIFKKAGLNVAPSVLFKKNSNPGATRMPFPLVLKPRNGGSSVGISIVNSVPEFKNKIKRVLANDDAVAEKYLPGREFTVGVLGNRALPVVEIKPKSKYKFFDYEAKYKTGASEEIVPAKIPPKLAKLLGRSAIKAHKAIGARAYSRSDFILNGGKFYILEINTLPGLTKNSLLPKAAKAAGVSFKQLLDIIILSSLR